MHFIDAAAGKFGEQRRQIDLPVGPRDENDLGAKLPEGGDPVRLGDGGAIAMSTSSGATRAIVDVVGWYGPGATGDLVPVTPIRLLDTRPSGAPLTTAGRTITLDRHHVPAGARAALVNLTAVVASAGMHLTAWAGGQA